MALPPIRPSDSAAIVPQPGDPACTVLTNMVQGLTQWNQFVGWLINEDGSATQDAIDWIGAGGTNALNAPTGVSASDDRTTDITVTWNAVSDAAYYVVYRGTTDDTSAMTPVSGNLTELSFVDTGTSSDVVVWYSVRAYSSSRISALATPNSGVKPTSAAPTTLTLDFPYASTDYTYVIPSGQAYATMELLMWGSGGLGGRFVTGPFVVPGPTRYAGGGGGAGSFLHITGVTVAPGETYVIRVGKRTATLLDGTTYVWRDEAGSAEVAGAKAGNDGGNGNYTFAGAGGPARGAGDWGTNALGSGTIDISGGDSSAIGSAGSAGSGATGGAGATGITQSGILAGGGGTGILIGSTTATDAAAGFVRIILRT